MPKREPDHVKELRRICMALPEATEQVFGGHTKPTWRIRDKIFVMYQEDLAAFWLKAPPGAQHVLVGADPERFFVPPYVGSKGWIGVRTTLPLDIEHVRDLVLDSYRMTAPKRLSATLDGSAPTLTPRRSRSR
jgi:predicted DNA-binding protein (MmcQ/YjbR family)